MPFSTVTLADYLQKVADLLRTSSAQNYGYWGQAMLTRFINDAMQQRDLVMGGLRSLVTVNMVAGTDTYVFTNTAGLESAFDIVSIEYTWGSRRVMMGQWPYTRLTTDLRTFTNLQRPPIAWARYNPTTVVLGPPPDQAYVSRWDVNTYSAALVLTTDADAIPFPYTDPVPYYAASLAKINERQYDEGREFEEIFFQRMERAGNSRSGILPNYYAVQRAG